MRSDPRRSPSVAGIVVLDKPAGTTSNRATRKVQRLFDSSRAGHLGTLDPFATGVLPVMLEEATRLGPMLEGADKTYAAEIALGVTTDTLDRDGKVIREKPVPPDAEALLRAAIPRFVGRVRQRIPDYSAAKIDGVRRCDRARAGKDLPPAEKEVEIRTIEIREVSMPRVAIEIECGPGTFVRQLASDLGDAIGCGAHVTSLRRTRSGPFSIRDAVTLEKIESEDPAARAALLHPLAGILPGPVVTVSEERMEEMNHGRPIDLPAGLSPDAATTILVIFDGVLRALGTIRDGRLWPKRVFGQDGIALRAAVTAEGT